MLQNLITETRTTCNVQTMELSAGQKRCCFVRVADTPISACGVQRSRFPICAESLSNVPTCHRTTLSTTATTSSSTGGLMCLKKTCGSVFWCAERLTLPLHAASSTTTP